MSGEGLCARRWGEASAWWVAHGKCGACGHRGRARLWVSGEHLRRLCGKRRSASNSWKKRGRGGGYVSDSSCVHWRERCTR